ncbi:MAG: ATPase domain-containing protein, partial [Promethearchaeota archaeon]
MALELKNIKSLKSPDLTKLRENGIVDVNYLAAATVHELESMGFGVERAQKVIEEAGKILDDFMGAKDGFLMGEDLIKQYNKMERLTTGCPSFDKILGGGFETQKVYEIYGKEKSGKSRLCHQLVARAHLPREKGGLGSPAGIYIDTEGTFNMKTLKTMAQYVGLDPEMVSKNLAYSKPPTSGTMNYIIWKHLPKIMEQTGARIVILDSIATHFRAEYGIARNLLPERQMRANQVIHNLKKAATKFNALIIMTNQAVANVTGYGAAYNHAMGLVVGHESQVRIRIQKRSGP